MRRFLITACISFAITLSLSAQTPQLFNNPQQLSTAFFDSAFAQEAELSSEPEAVSPEEESSADSAESDTLPPTGDERVFQDDFLPPDLPDTTIETFSPWRATAGALFVLGLLFVAVWVAKKFTKSGTVFTAGRQLKVIESISIGAGKQVVLLKAGKRMVLLAVSSAGISALDRFPASELGGDESISGTIEAEALEEENITGLFEEKLSEMRRKLKGAGDDSEQK